MQKRERYYGLMLEFHTELLEADEPAEKYLDRFMALLKKHRVVDILGQVSYWSDESLVIESPRWKTKPELKQVLDELSEEPYSAVIYVTIEDEKTKRERSGWLLTI